MSRLTSIHMRVALVVCGIAPLAACSLLAGLEKDFERVECLRDCDGGSPESAANAGDGAAGDAAPGDAYVEADSDAAADPCGYVDVTDPAILASTDFAGFRMPNANGINMISNVVDGDVVHDKTTGLTWRRESASTAMTVGEGATYCAGLAADGGSPWRMPTRIELASLLRYNPLFDVNGNYVPPCIASDYVPYGPATFFLSSTPVAATAAPLQHWAFTYGTCGAEPLSGAHSIRCVQGKLTKPRFQVSVACNSIRDLNTLLEWDRHLETTEYIRDTDAGPVEAASNYCASLDTTKGSVGWTVPTQPEVYSLVDSLQRDPAVNAILFPGTPGAGKIMSSSRRDVFTNLAAVRLDTGGETGVSVTNKALLRCVRHVVN
jgi:hypothetical protein